MIRRSSNLSQNFVNHQICHRILHQIWWITKFITKFGDNFITNFGDFQIWWQIRHQTSRAHTFRSVSPSFRMSVTLFRISILSLSLRPHKASRQHCCGRHEGGQGGWQVGRHGSRKKWPTWSWTWWPTWRKFSTRPLNNPFDFEQAFFFIIETFEKCEWTHRLKNVHFLEI